MAGPYASVGTPTSSSPTVPAGGPTVSSLNQQGNQLLSQPNPQLIGQMQAGLRQGITPPGGLRTPATGQSSFPTGGMAGGMNALSPNPMTANPQMQAMIAALQGQQTHG